MTEPPRQVLLIDGSSYATLAAARYFGRNGYHVVLADFAGRTATQRSLFVNERLRCPGRHDFAAMEQWLADFGRQRPGFLLYPSDDDLAWIIASAQDRLATHFVMLQPTFKTIETLLNKHMLYELCAQLGIPTPFTAYPQDPDHLLELTGDLTGKFLVKPKTQVGIKVGCKAVMAEAGPALVQAYRGFQRRIGYTDTVRRHDPALAWPMLQEFNPSAATQTVSIAGFRSTEGDALYTLSSRKLLQYPLNIGVGMCFEAIPVAPTLRDQVRQICEAVTYFGAFEVEFVKSGEGYALTDFNPRFYGQMQLEISRGLPIPGLVAAAAHGVRQDFALRVPPTWRLANRSQLKLVMTTQWMARRVSWAERSWWLRFADPSDGNYVDQVYDPDDRRPWLADIISRRADHFRHPRSALRTLFGTE